MAGPWEYFGACNYSEACYSHSNLVAAATVPYPKSRWEKVLATIEQQWIVHSMEAAVENSWEMPESDVTDPSMPELDVSSGEDDNASQASEARSSDSESGDLSDMLDRLALAAAARPHRQWILRYRSLVGIRLPMLRSAAEMQPLDTDLAPSFEHLSVHFDGHIRRWLNM